MGVSTDGIICYGVILDEDCYCPWDEEKYDGEIEEWWLDEIGFDIPSPYDNDGRKPGVTEEEVSHYWDKRREARLTCPFDLVNYCSGDYPEYVLIMNGTETRCNRGYPTEIDLNNDFDIDDTEFREALKKYEITDEEPKWYLCSYWG